MDSARTVVGLLLVLVHGSPYSHAPRVYLHEMVKGALGPCEIALWIVRMHRAPGLRLAYCYQAQPALRPVLDFLLGFKFLGFAFWTESRSFPNPFNNDHTYTLWWGWSTMLIPFIWIGIPCLYPMMGSKYHICTLWLGHNQNHELRVTMYTLQLARIKIQLG